MTIQPFPKEKRDIQAVIIDLDGTLLLTNHELGQRNVDAVKKVVAAGVKVIIATGKSRGAAKPVIDALGLDTPGVFVQGLFVANADGTPRHQQTIEAAIARRVITYITQNGFKLLIYSGNRLLIQSEDDELMQITKYGEPEPEIVGSMVNVLHNTPIHKIIAFGATKRLTALRWQLSQQTDGEVTMTTSAVLNTLEILPKGASKGRSVRKLLADMNIDPQNVMAIGDGENDIDMIKLAGLGVAVGNADERLKEVADEVVGTNDEYGVAEALERFVLGVADETDDKSDEPDAADAETVTADAPVGEDKAESEEG